MALELLEQLGHDLERWVWSGALAARADRKLEAHENALGKVGGKVPALARVSELAGALRSATTRKAPAALLQLDVAVQQLRAAQLEVDAPEGELKPLPEGAPELEPVPTHALYSLLDATEGFKRPPEGVESMLRTTPFHRDPRTWDTLYVAINHADLCDTMVPAVSAMGSRALPRLERDLDLRRGTTGDAARLRAIGAIRKERGAALYREALEKADTDPMKLAALECLRYVSEEEFEREAEKLTPDAGSRFREALSRMRDHSRSRHD